ncbi:DUF6286 domain-containing protein [Actinomadura flavalba]|uniref:DUF6286 domain-containing protein n=1 Tax=Actinomadura flavalba TaxID=1120938 RepID=UPI00037FD8F8|nr:DUF6286 domain-containing protein [Actinomadura flavalba]
MTSTTGRLPQSATGRQTAAKTGGKADRRARHTFRTRRVWPAVVVAALLTAAAVLTAIEVISALAGSPLRLVPYDDVTSWARSNAWSSTWALVASGVVALLGLLVLLIGLVPGRTRLIPLHGTDPDLLVGVTRGGLKSAAEAAARSVDGVTGVGDVKIKKRRMLLTARTPLRNDDGLAGKTRAAVQERLDELGPVPRRKVKVRIERRT